MNQTEVLSEIQKLQEDIMEKKQRLAEMMRNVAPKKVKNYVFKSFRQGDVSLLDLFEEKDELIVVHNMGKSCMYCTTWADGLNGLYHHIRRKAAFVVSTPDSTEVQENVAAERSWVFPMVSTKDTTFKEDTGFAKDNLYYPGVSIFQKTKKAIFISMRMLLLDLVMTFVPCGHYLICCHQAIQITNRTKKSMTVLPFS